MLLAGEGFVVVTGGYGGLMTAVRRGVREAGGHVIGLPMRHWSAIEPNSWNVDLRWSTDYGTCINHILHYDAVVALPGGVGTLSEMTMVWEASQTENPPATYPSRRLLAAAHQDHSRANGSERCRPEPPAICGKSGRSGAADTNQLTG